METDRLGVNRQLKPGPIFKIKVKTLNDNNKVFFFYYELTYVALLVPTLLGILNKNVCP